MYLLAALCMAAVSCQRGSKRKCPLKVRENVVIPGLTKQYSPLAREGRQVHDDSFLPFLSPSGVAMGGAGAQSWRM